MKCTVLGSNILNYFNTHVRQHGNHSNGFDNSSIGSDNSSIGIDNYRSSRNDSIPLNIEHLWEDHYNYLLIANIFLAFFLIVPNSAVILGLVKTSRNGVKIPQKIFILSSSCCCLIGISYFVPVFIDSCTLEYILEMAYSWILMCESEFMLTLSVTRLISVKWPFFEIEWKTMKKIIIAEIVFALSIPVAMFFINGNDFLAWLIQGLLFLIWLVVMFCLACMSIYCVLSRSRDRGLRANVAASRQDYNRIWKPIIRLATIQTAYVLCHLPLTVFSFAHIPAKQQTMSLEETTKNKIITLWLYTLMDFYNGLNACLYMAQSVEIRSYYLRLLTCGLRGVGTNQQHPAVIGSSVRSTATVSSSVRSRASNSINQNFNGGIRESNGIPEIIERDLTTGHATMFK